MDRLFILSVGVFTISIVLPLTSLAKVSDFDDLISQSFQEQAITAHKMKLKPLIRVEDPTLLRKGFPGKIKLVKTAKF